MRELITREMEAVSGGDWHVGFDLGFVDGWVEGEESAQEIVAATANVASDAYWGARDAMADFYEWAANGWNYSMACSYHYY